MTATYMFTRRRVMRPDSCSRPTPVESHQTSAEHRSRLSDSALWTSTRSSVAVTLKKPHKQPRRWNRLRFHRLHSKSTKHSRVGETVAQHAPRSAQPCCHHGKNVHVHPCCRLYDLLLDLRHCQDQVHQAHHSNNCHKKRMNRRTIDATVALRTAKKR